MINSNMRTYSFFLIDTNSTGYGQQVLIKDKDGTPKEQGKIKMSIVENSQAIQDTIEYMNSAYVGLTHSPLTDRHVINYNGTLLKVQHYTLGRFSVVYLGEYYE